ncbi:MAG: hypothetical protein ACRD2N_15025 [Vicinamibacterales bacterium]
MTLLSLMSSRARVFVLQRIQKSAVFQSVNWKNCTVLRRNTLVKLRARVQNH